MDVIVSRGCGLDVHQATIVACLLTGEPGALPRKQVKTFSAMTEGLIELRDWLKSAGCTAVAMEATGVYWKPVWHVLEDHVTLVLANAMHIRNIPGRKSDKNDATWIADLLALGLIRSSFVPPAPIQELRDLTRTRKQLVRERARHMQRIQKTLEDANVKLTEVIADILGTSGRAILTALIAGETDPERLADLTSGRLKATRAQLLEALHGRVTAHHRFILKLHLTHIAALDTAVADVEARIREALAPFRAAVSLLMTMPGVSETAAAVILSEIGDDMSKFPSAGHLLSWAGLCPRLDESAGKRRSTRTRPGAPWLKTTLVQIAWPAARKKHSYFHAQFLRLKSRRGPKKAIVAVAASMLTAVYYMLRDGAEFHDLGDQHFVQRDKTRLANRLLQRLRDLGVEVEVKAA
jgi:transposase